MNKKLYTVVYQDDEYNEQTATFSDLKAAKAFYEMKDWEGSRLVRAEGFTTNLRWDTRGNATSEEEAIALLGGVIWNDLEDIDDRWDEAEEFAKKWNIPFDSRVIRAAKLTMAESVPNWSSSSMSC